MIKKIAVIAAFSHITFASAAEHKEAPATPQSKPSISFSGALPATRHSFELAPITIHTDTLQAFKQAVKEVKVTIDAAPEVTVNSDVIERAAKALRATLQVELPDQTRDNVIEIIQAATIKCPPALGCAGACYSISSGAAAQSCCCCFLTCGCMCALGAILITPYSVIKDGTKQSLAFLTEQIKRCQKPPHLMN